MIINITLKTLVNFFSFLPLSFIGVKYIFEFYLT